MNKRNLLLTNGNPTVDQLLLQKYKTAEEYLMMTKKLYEQAQNLYKTKEESLSKKSKKKKKGRKSKLAKSRSPIKKSPKFKKTKRKTRKSPPPGLPSRQNQMLVKKKSISPPPAVLKKLNEIRIHQWLAAEKISKRNQMKSNGIENVFANHNNNLQVDPFTFHKKRQSIKKASCFKPKFRKSPNRELFKRRLGQQVINVDINPTLHGSQSIPLMLNLNIKCPHAQNSSPKFGMR